MIKTGLENLRTRREFIEILYTLAWFDGCNQSLGVVLWIPDEVPPTYTMGTLLDPWSGQNLERHDDQDGTAQDVKKSMEMM